MNKDLKLFGSLLLASIIYCYLMWYQELGINSIIFSTLLVTAIACYKKEYKNKVFMVYAILFIASSAAVVLTGLIYSKIIYYISLFAFICVAQSPQIKSLTYSSLSYISNIFIGLVPVSNMVLDSILGVFSIKKIKGNLITRIIVASVIFVVFFFIFTHSNPKFAQLSGNIFDPIVKFISNVFVDFSFLNMLHFFFVFYFLALLVIKLKPNFALKNDERNEDDFKRNRSYTLGNNMTMGLKNEYKTALLSILTINILLLTLNLTDIFSVWLGVVPDSAAELSDFVHKGTYSLIFSVILSIIILLFFFRKNLNIFPNNKKLKVLAYVWIAQNLFLLCSVGLRNAHYISECGLTYKRMGVFIFLIITSIGLLFLYFKINNKKTIYYYFRMCTFGFFVTLVTSSLFNWDVIICKYNICKNSNPDYNYMQSLSKQTSPYLPKNYVNNRMYTREVETRDWRSFNFGDYCAVKKLKSPTN